MGYGHPAGRRLAAVVAALALIGASCGHKARRHHAAAPSPSPRPPGKADFGPGSILAYDAQDRKEAGPRANQEVGKILAFLDNYYNIAFLDPAKWQGGNHPDLAALFTQEASTSVKPNIGALALAEIASQVKRVDPTKQQATQIAVLIEPDLSVSFATVTTTFEATGEAVQPGLEPVKITHTTDLLLAKDGDSYKIAAYNVSETAHASTKTAAFGRVSFAAGKGS